MHMYTHRAVASHTTDLRGFGSLPTVTTESWPFLHRRLDHVTKKHATVCTSSCSLRCCWCCSRCGLLRSCTTLGWSDLSLLSCLCDLQAKDSGLWHNEFTSTGNILGSNSNRSRKEEEEFRDHPMPLFVWNKMLLIGFATVGSFNWSKASRDSSRTDFDASLFKHKNER